MDTPEISTSVCVCVVDAKKKGLKAEIRECGTGKGGGGGGGGKE